MTVSKTSVLVFPLCKFHTVRQQLFGCVYKNSGQDNIFVDSEVLEQELIQILTCTYQNMQYL